MHAVVTILTVVSAAAALLGLVEILLLLFRLHAPFTATGEVLLFLLSLGRRKPRYTRALGSAQVGIRGADIFPIA